MAHEPYLDNDTDTRLEWSYCSFMHIMMLWGDQNIEWYINQDRAAICEVVVSVQDSFVMHSLHISGTASYGCHNRNKVFQVLWFTLK